MMPKIAPKKQKIRRQTPRDLWDIFIDIGKKIDQFVELKKNKENLETTIWTIALSYTAALNSSSLIIFIITNVN